MTHLQQINNCFKIKVHKWKCQDGALVTGCVQMAPPAGVSGCSMKKKESSTGDQMKVFIQYGDTRGIHLYTASTSSFSYQNKSYQGQVCIFNTHLHVSQQRISTLSGFEPPCWVTPHTHGLPSTITLSQADLEYSTPVHDESDDTREWYIHLWPGNHMSVSPPRRNREDTEMGKAHNGRTGVTNMQGFWKQREFVQLRLRCLVEGKL